MSSEEKVKTTGNYSILCGSLAYPSSNNGDVKKIAEKDICCGVFAEQNGKTGTVKEGKR